MSVVAVHSLDVLSSSTCPLYAHLLSIDRLGDAW